MRTKIVKLLLRKELRDVFRDKKAVIMMILVPIIIYPLIFLAAFSVMAMIQSGMEHHEYKVVINADDEAMLENAIVKHNEESRKQAEENDDQNSQEVVNLLTVVSDADITDDEIAKQKLQSEDIDVYVTGKPDDQGVMTYNVMYVSSITNSNYASGLIEDIVDDMKYDKTYELVEEAGLDAKFIMNPMKAKDNDIASDEQFAGSLLGTILPFMLVVSLLMGTMYPAIDTTSGEKERGTLETLLTLPVKNHEIIIAKFLTVAFVGIISAVLNIASMIFLIVYAIKMLKEMYKGSANIAIANINIASFWPAILVTALAVIAFSLFISAATMCITALAKSYKEANNYITPFMLVVMLTGYIGFIPNIELTPKMAMVPVANICLLVKEILLFKVNVSSIVIVLISNIIYAIAAVAFLSKIYDSEGILFDEGRNGLQLFELRSNMKKGGVPTTGDAWFIVLVTTAAFIFLGSALQLKFKLGGVVGIQLILLIIPLAYVLYTKRSIRKTYSLNVPKPIIFAATFLVGFGIISIALVLGWLAMVLFPDATAKLEDDLSASLFGDSFVVAFLVVAVTPAICEEMLFRGFLFSGFRSKYRVPVAIILVSILFGLYHMSFIRFFITATLGLGQALAVYYSDSIIPAMIIHLMNNGFSVIQMYYSEQLKRLLPLLYPEDLSIISAVVLTLVGIVTFTIGILIMRRTKLKSIQVVENG